MTATEVARKNSGAILFEAISKSYDILDCIVDIDLRVTPPSIEVVLSADFLSADPNEDSESLLVKKMQIDEARKKKCLPFNYIGDGEGIVKVGMIDFHEAPASAVVPGKVSLFGKTWPEAQTNLKRILSKILSGDLKKVESIPGFIVDEVEKMMAKSYLRKMDGGDLDYEEVIAEDINNLMKAMSIDTTSRSGFPTLRNSGRIMVSAERVFFTSRRILAIFFSTVFLLLLYIASSEALLMQMRT